MWDRSISEQNLFGGLGHVTRRFASSKLVPAMLKHGLLEKRREHNMVIYMLTKEARDDARAAIENDDIRGVVLEVVEELA